MHNLFYLSVQVKLLAHILSPVLEGLEVAFEAVSTRTSMILIIATLF